MKYLEFLEEVAEKSEYQKNETKDITRLVFKELADLVAHGDSLKIPSLGTFGIRWIAPRRIRNIHTGEYQDVGRSPILKFTPTPKMKQKVKENCV